MSTSKNQHIVPNNGKWSVKGEGNSKATSTHETKTEAVKAGTEIAKNQKAELVIHGRNGRIQDKDSYGNDPCPPKDKKH